MYIRANKCNTMQRTIVNQLIGWKQKSARKPLILNGAHQNVRSKSLKTYIDKFPSLHGLRLSMQPYRKQDWMTNMPLYAPPCWLSSVL